MDGYLMKHPKTGEECFVYGWEKSKILKHNGWIEIAYYPSEEDYDFYDDMEELIDMFSR